jgi:hypothetical protein
VKSLTNSQIEILFSKALDSIITNALPLPREGEKETAFTQRVILPFVTEWVKTLNVGGLHVRGDGGLNPLKVVWDGISLYPDVTVMQFHDRLVSYEVKFLKPEDPGGSLTKAIGQTLMYEKAGFASSIGVIVDCRKIQPVHVGFRHSESIQLSDHATVCIFKPIAVR